jgi:hypothetical protein
LEKYYFKFMYKNEIDKMTVKADSYEEGLEKAKE